MTSFCGTGFKGVTMYLALNFKDVSTFKEDAKRRIKCLCSSDLSPATYMPWVNQLAEVCE